MHQNCNTTEHTRYRRIFGIRARLTLLVCTLVIGSTAILAWSSWIQVNEALIERESTQLRETKQGVGRGLSSLIDALHEDILYLRPSALHPCHPART
jgi:hypothetical protein